MIKIAHVASAVVAAGLLLNVTSGVANAATPAKHAVTESHPTAASSPKIALSDDSSDDKDKGKNASTFDKVASCSKKISKGFAEGAVFGCIATAEAACAGGPIGGVVGAGKGAYECGSG